MRADLALVEAGLCSSRTQARQSIEAGLVFQSVAGKQEPIRKASQSVLSIQGLSIQGESEHFVSRGGIKLSNALKTLCLDVNGLSCVDFGQSTGGFTDCLLQSGASGVVGFDVGHGQLHASLLNHPKVRCFEGVNLKDADGSSWATQLKELGSGFYPFDLAVADLSFISLRRALPGLISFLSQPALCLFLVKPQFELGKEFIGKNGLLKPVENLPDLLRDLTFQAFEQANIKPLNLIECAIKGGDGNQEYFALGQFQATNQKNK